jgi:pimeloyl-ACP methyl ester carboxylesterase
MQLTPWQHTAREGFTLRGWHTRPSGKPLLHFLHGNGFCGRVYEPMLKQLSADFDLWLCDIQGHGDSDHGGPFVGWNRNAELALEAFQKHGQAFHDAPHYAVGHSFGGVLTALILCERKQPFASAVLLDPVLFTPAMIMGLSMAELTGVAKLTPMARAALRRRKHWPSRDEAFASLHGRGTYKGWSDEALRAFVDHALKDTADGGVELKCRRGREAEIFSSAPERLWGRLGRVRVPTLVLHAKHTYPFVSESVARWQLINDAIEAQEVEGGHCFMQERPEEAAEKIRLHLLGRP